MKRQVILGWSLVFCLAFGLCASRSLGQAVYGSIFGTVTDPQGNVVAAAKVTVTSVTKGTAFDTTTNESGNYSVTHLIPDAYRVKIEAVGFQSYDVASVQVSADAAARLDAQLQVGTVTQTVEVTGEVPQLKTDRSDVSTLFSTREVDELPILNRNFTTFQLLTPGTQMVTWQHASSENPQQSIQINVNGQHFSGTSYQLDGTDNRDPILGIIVINPNLDGVTELKVTTQNYDAEFGQASAAVITSQTRSGSNTLHGSAFLFRRNDVTQARDPFKQATPDPVTKRLIPASLWDQFGGSLGGRIVPDKLFFFGDYQGTREKVGNSAVVTVPTALVHSTCLVPAAPGLSCDLSEYLPTKIYDPLSGAADGTGRTAFAGNLIPHDPTNDRISPQAINLLSLLPPPCSTCTGIKNNYAAGGNGIFNADSFDTRIDYPLSQKWQIFGRYSFANYTLTGGSIFDTATVKLGGKGLGTNGFGAQSKSRDQSLATGFNYTLSPTWLTDFRLGWFKYHVHVNPNGLGSTPAKDAGVPGLNLGDMFTSGMPAFFIDQSIPGDDDSKIFFGYGLDDHLNRCNCPLEEREDQFQWVNNWTNIRGNHAIKFGADIRYARNLRVASDKHRSGELHFSKDGTGLSGPSGGGGVGLATFLLGDVTSLERYVSSSTDAGDRQKRWFFYGQDTWRFSPKITFNYGLRWEIYFPQTVTGAGKGGFVDLSTGNVRTAGVGGIGLNMDVENTFTNFAPRLGIAYQATPKTVVRLGYGRSYDIGVFGSVFGHSVTQNLPVLGTQALSGPITGSSFETAFTLTAGPSAFVFPTVPSNGQFPLPDKVVQFPKPNKMRLGLVDAWNATVQRQITPTMSVEVAYVGNKGTHVFAGNGPDYNVNQATLAGFLSGLSNKQRRPFFAGPINGFGAAYGWSQNLRYLGNDASNHYNAFETKVEKRFTHGYQLLAHYTLSRNTNWDNDGYNFNKTVTFGVADFNRTHEFVFTNIVELPVGRNKRFLSDVSRPLDYVVGGWQLSSTTNWSSGLPFNFKYGECSSDIDTDAGPCRPDLVGGIHYTGNKNQWFVPATGALATNGATSGSWGRPQRGQFGNVERNAGRGPRFFNTDLSLFKKIPITERYTAQFRMETFNVFNHVNLGTPGVFFSEFQGGGGNCVDCSDGGQITSLGGRMRRIQFAIRFDF